MNQKQQSDPSGAQSRQGSRSPGQRQSEQSDPGQARRDAQDDRMGRDRSLQQGSDHTNRGGGGAQER